MIWVDKKELDADLEFIGQLKSPDDAVVANESMFVITILKKIKKWD